MIRNLVGLVLIILGVLISFYGSMYLMLWGGINDLINSQNITIAIMKIIFFLVGAIPGSLIALVGVATISDF